MRATRAHRLKRLAAAGDLDAAEQLWASARRHRDADGLTVAALTLGDVERVAEAFQLACDLGDAELAARAAAGVGVVVDGGHIEAIGDRLDAVNAASDWPLTLAHVLLTLVDAQASPRGVAYHVGGEGYEAQRTTVCLAVRASHRADCLVVGLATAPAWRCSPGRAWQELQPWLHDRVDADREPLRSWAASPESNHFEIGLCEPLPRPVTDAPPTRREQLDEMLLHPEQVGWPAIEQFVAEWPDDAGRDDAVLRVREAAFGNVELERRASLAWLEAWRRDEPRAPLLDRLLLNQRNLGDETVVELVQAESIAHFVALELAGNQLTDDAARALAASPHVRRLQRLVLRDNAFGQPGFDAIASAPLDHLTWLDLSRARHPLTTSLSLASWRLPRVRTLLLRELHLGDAGLRSLLSTDEVSAVRWLALDDNALTPEGVRSLAAAPHLRGLEHLTLSNNPVLGDEAVAMLAADAPEGLVQLDLIRCGVGPRGLRELVASPLRERLAVLSLDGNLRLGEGDIGVRTLTRRPWPRLERLHLGACQIGADALVHLTHQADERLPALRHLDLPDNRLDEAAADALATWPGLARLRSLELSRVRLSQAFIDRLARSPYLRPGVVRGVRELDDRAAPRRFVYTIGSD